MDQNGFEMSESRALFVLANEDVRYKVVESVWRAEPGSRVEIKGPKRTLDQNARMWATLTDIAEQVDWHGVKYSPEDWKDYFMHAMKRARWMPCEEGGLVPIGMHTSSISKSEMSDLVILMEEFGARNGVAFGDSR